MRATKIKVARRLIASPVFLCGLIVALLLSSASIQAQQQRSPSRGFQTAASYALSDIETINTTNGNMLLRIPLASLPAGRGGGPGFTLFLHYNSKLWNSRGENFNDGSLDETGNPRSYSVNYLEPSDEGGWDYGFYYKLQLTSRLNLEPAQPCSTGDEFKKNAYIWKLQMTFPDGSVHQFAPAGYQDHFNDGYYNINPNGVIRQVSATSVGDGSCSSSVSEYPAVTSGMTYYSTDGTYMRLEIQHASSGNGVTNPWTLYFPDGRKVEETRTPGAGYNQKNYDRNNNYITIQNNTVTDQLGRSITVTGGPEGDIVRTQGVGGENVDTVVKWAWMWVNRPYIGTSDLGAPLDKKNQTLTQDIRVVEKITLPSQADSLTYNFGYNGKTTQPAAGDYSDGWGEISSITMPSGAQATYSYWLDGPQPGADAFTVLRNYPSKKKLTYELEYDGGTQSAPDEIWEYNIGPQSSSIKGPDGGITTQYHFETWQNPSQDSGLVYKTVASDGTMVERIWAYNHVQGAYNQYVKTEYKSIKNGAGTAYVQTAITDYEYDKNGNLTKVTEYDWVPYGNVPRDSYGQITGIPSGATKKRVTTNTYYNPAASATDTNIYLNSNNGRRLINLIKSTEISDGTQTLARTEFFYDNIETTGNLTEQRSWDNSKGAYSSSLTASNSISVSNQYDGYGNVTLSIDAKGIKTKYTYASISGNLDLYPTQIEVAYEQAEKRTTQQEYDFYTGLVTLSTDVDNGVSTRTTYDDLGRPTLIRAAEGKPEEIITQTIYDEAERRVIVKSDLNTAGDGKLVSIQHLDQLGRVRLTRQLEDSASESPTSETTGIKVETRYKVDATNNFTYQLVSNPYRAPYSNQVGSDPTMGWTRTKLDKGGRVVEVQTFSGSSLPAPWGTNTNSTGTVTTSYDVEFVTVTDQAGKARRSMTDALGRLLRVDEPNDINNPANLGSTSAPVQHTSYTYDALGNLTQVNQGDQTPRIFTYSSLSRLTSASNPESGTIEYKYDASGNLVLKIDPRSRPGSGTLQNCSIPYTGTKIATCYEYDSLNRLKTRTYNDGTPNVTYTYDTLAANGKGRLSSVSSSVSTTSYSQYDALGRVRASKQETQGATEPYTFEYNYNLAGALTSQKYPSGKVFVTEYDSVGRMSGVKKHGGGYYVGADPTSQDYEANRIKYTAHGAISAMRLGNGLWEHTGFNSRLQPIEIGLGTSAADSDTLKLNYAYGVRVNNVLNATKNNGNVESQTITGAGLNLTQSYTYDQLNRLKTFVETENASQTVGLTQTYDYDRWGNRAVTAGYRQQQTITPTPQSLSDFNTSNNRIVNTSYDSAGNMTSAVQGHLFSYDAENKMTSHDDGQTVGTLDNQYSYDGDGRRVKKVTGSVTTIFVYNAMGQMAAEYTDYNTSQTTGTSYFTADHLGTPRVITNSQGSVISRHDYLPFGEEIKAGSGGRTAGQGYVEDADGVRQKFTQKERDSETGLDYFLARYYSSAQGRFTGVDPENAGAYEDDPQSWNGYAYARNNPQLFTDPDGKKYVICNAEGKDCVTYSDEEFYRIRRESQHAHGFTGNRDFYESGAITTNGETIATYRQVSIDDPVSEFFFEMRRRTAPMVPLGEIAVDLMPVPGPKIGIIRRVGRVANAVIPKVTNRKLQNIIRDLFKGALTKNPIGTGSTADAVRSELQTGIPVGGKFHSQKAAEYVRALENWLQKNPNASHRDRLVAQSMLDDLKSALAGK